MIDSNSGNVNKIASASNNDSEKFENRLRPILMNDYIGQENIKKNLEIAIKASIKRNDTLEHILLHGPPGLGKTTLANIIAHELGTNLKITSGPALEKQGDVASIISSLKENDILFIDEIHRLKPVVEEILYTAMEDFAIDIIVGKGPTARSMRISLPKFTLIGATTKISMLSSPLRDRFGNIFSLQLYSSEEIQLILSRSAKILNVEIDEYCSKILAKTCRNTPRIANRLLKRVRDFAQVKNQNIITAELLDNALLSLGIDELGLDYKDRQILNVIIKKFDGGPVGLNTLSAALSEEVATIEDIYEPFLIQLGLLQRTPKGRIVTQTAFRHLGF